MKMCSVFRRECINDFLLNYTSFDKLIGFPLVQKEIKLSSILVKINY